MSAATETKDDRKYTKEHEWARSEKDELVVGITAFAVDQLGDVTLVGIDAKVGATLEAHKPFGTIESVKTLSDLFSPIDGTVEKINDTLENAPERVNEDCWDKGWMVAIKPQDPKAIDSLMDAKAYGEHIASLEH